jgi:hypothetical protein
MKVLDLEGTEHTPKVILDKKNGIFEISGRSLQDDTAQFYKPILDWIKEYSADPNPATDFIINLEYFNTASSKVLLDVFSALENIKGAKVVWCFQDDDEDMEEKGEEFAELVKIPFEFKAH